MRNVYLCGPTVYSDVHIGNLRPILIFDIYLKSLRYLNVNFNFVHNITDIDDKIIQKALDSNKTEKEISAHYIKSYKHLLNVLNIDTINQMPTVTENMRPIIELITNLINKEAAYVREGNVYFDTSKYSDYGHMSNQKLDKNRFEKSEEKINPPDFVLWKKTDLGIVFDSPWGKGRPGWHTECASFVGNIFKANTIDLHGGGSDLIFPHHENESAQFEVAFNKKISNYWKHIGQVNWDGVKMSKSLGNIISGNDFIDKYGSDLLRFIFFVSNITSPLVLNNEKIESSKITFKRWEDSFMKSRIVAKKSDMSLFAKLVTNWEWNKAQTMLADNIKLFNVNKDEDSASNINGMMKIIGFSFTNNEINLKQRELYQSWKTNLKNENFEKADVIRADLIKMKII